MRNRVKTCSESRRSVPCVLLDRLTRYYLDACRAILNFYNQDGLSNLRKMRPRVQQQPAGTEVIRGKFGDFDAFAEAVQGWNLDFCQLTRASAHFSLEQVIGEKLMISRALLPSDFHQTGSTASGCRTVSLVTPGSQLLGWRWCGESVTHNSLLVMPVDGQFESYSRQGLDSMHLTLSTAMLDQVAQARFELPLATLMPDQRSFCARGGSALGELRALLVGLTSVYALRHPGAARLTPEVEEELAYLVLACLACSDLPAATFSGRLRVLDRAVRMLRSEQGLSLDIAELAVATGTSRRTLENAFRDGFGLGPGKYIKALRLNAVNRVLRHGEGGTSVADVACQHGFRHLGQFAADYRRLFGELPSRTLARRNGHSRQSVSEPGWAQRRGDSASAQPIPRTLQQVGDRATP